ncbi:MAG: CoA-binding protein [Alphaproteobacteria bacterium]|nr:CoA-binding protein [Alphaproteobacteria bacterium]
MSDALDALLRPRSVAIIGASTDPDRIGGRPIQFLRRAGFAGAIYPVNPRAAEVQGIPAFAAIGALPAVPDVAIVALPASVVGETVDACLARGTRAFIVFSAVFGEAGEEGRRAQADITARVCAAGGRMLGPNSLCLLATGSGFFGTFATALDGAWPRPGPSPSPPSRAPAAPTCWPWARRAALASPALSPPATRPMSMWPTSWPGWPAIPIAT